MSKIDLTQKPGSLQAWLDYLDSIDPNKMKLGLERIKVVLERLNLSLFNEIPVITVAGTNGKGSTAALIANALNFSKIKTGLYWTAPTTFTTTAPTTGLKLQVVELTDTADGQAAFKIQVL